MKIRFKQQLKNKKRLSIFNGEEYLFSISEYTFAKNNLYDGMEISSLDEFMTKCQIGENFNYCLNILSKKSYTKKEIFDKLIKRECSDNTANAIINELLEKKFISDTDYRDDFIKSRQANKKHGFMKIRQDLYKKGIKLELDDYDKEAELENLDIIIREYLNKKMEDKKIIARLLGKGYKFSDIINAIKKFKSCEFEISLEEDFDE